jgi:heme/copper-type cytochrome/quinol oxidase subunit 2
VGHPRSRRAWHLVLVVAAIGVGSLVAWLTLSHGTDPAPRSASARTQDPAPIVVVARRYTFSPAQIEVQKDHIVKITLDAQDIAHSFTLDAYRIAKRAAPGQSVTFEFRADQEGSFPFYCNLTVDEGCRRMRGLLVVRPRIP